MRLYFLFILLVICSCSNHDNKATITTTKKTNNINNIKSMIDSSMVVNSNNEITQVKNYSYSDIAKFTIAAIMGKNPNNLKVKKESDNYIVSYVLEGKSYNYKVQILQFKNQVMWGNLDGRWRNHNLDEKIFFEDKNGNLKIIQKFSDDSESVNEYSH